MTSRIESRRKAYRFILKKIKSIDIVKKYRLNQIANDTDCISLDDLIGLTESTEDPSPQFVTSLKEFLQGTANEKGIDHYLVRPFRNKTIHYSRITHS